MEATLRKDALPRIGSSPVDTLTPPDILEVICPIEQRGSLDIAARVLQRISAICRYAVQTGRAISNPARDMKGALKTRPVTPGKALMKEDLPEFFVRFAKSQDHVITKAALKFIILTAVRSGEARFAVWSEVDFASRIWSIPADRMKMRKPHIVPLSGQAIALLEAMPSCNE